MKHVLLRGRGTPAQVLAQIETVAEWPKGRVLFGPGRLPRPMEHDEAMRWLTQHSVLIKGLGEEEA